MSDEADEPIDEPGWAPGWDAIDGWVGAHFGGSARDGGGQVPHQFTSSTAYELDSQSPLPAITVWRTRAPEGWLYVTYGLSELFDKSSDDPTLSGFGFELTLRTPMAPGQNGDSTPPRWPLRLLQGLGRHVLTTRTGFDSGHTLELGGPIVPPHSDGPEDCVLTGLICLPDPLLGKIETVHGSLLFLRLFGASGEELAILAQLSLGSLVACIAELSPMALTDPGRPSFTEDPERGKVLTRYKLGIEL